MENLFNESNDTPQVNEKPSLFHSIITAARETRPTQRAWETINKGYYDKPLATFLQQARTNRIPTYANLGRFLPNLIESLTALTVKAP